MAFSVFFRKTKFFGSMSFQRQQDHFVLDTAVIACEPVTGAHDPVAGDEDTNGVYGNCLSHCLGTGGTQHFGKLTVGDRFPIGDLQQKLPDTHLKRRAGRSKRKRSRGGGFPSKVITHPIDSIR